MISAFRRARRRWTAAVAVSVIGTASLLFVAPAHAYDMPAFALPHASSAPVPFLERAEDAAGVLELWRTGGPATRAAAKFALVGGVEALDKFLHAGAWGDAGQDVALQADRKQLVTELTERGSAHVRASATKILAASATDPTAIDKFLAEGWANSWQLDLRITATYFLDSAVPGIRRAASASLDAGGAAVEKFVLYGWKGTAELEDRIATYQLIESGSASVSLGAQAALDANDPDTVAAFLRYGQFVAADRDTETAAVVKLLEQVKADAASGPSDPAAFAQRAGTAVALARTTAATARTADTARLVDERDFRSAQAMPERAIDNAEIAADEGAKAAYGEAALELPGLLATLTVPGVDLDAHIKEARQATLDLALTGGPEVKEAAEAALLGGDSVIKSFIANYPEVLKRNEPSLVDDRQRVFQSIDGDGDRVDEAAKGALASGNPAQVRYFLEYGLASAQHLDNAILATYLLESDGQELRAAASVALDGSRAGLQTFATAERFAAAERDAATAAHVARIDAMIAELARIADQAELDARTAADTAKAAEAARQAGAGSSGQAAPLVDASQSAEAAPAVVPWPPASAPAVVLAETGSAPEAEALPGGLPTVQAPPAIPATPSDAVAVEGQNPESASPLVSTSSELNWWTIGLIVALVAAAAGAITSVVRRKAKA
ncbi:ALF repeat-containing protein [Arthrobacter cavernae]|uniref:ALF repeat-containing protein n=1 Tax=Arthrobacter cavernae TaxID=2817681 RepID=A0A939HJK3_9MICC|nr:ALF repeat-containing protein [Arthrobacter cavernae]MBO1269021.1 ALF repeat-containing protein [Arthrobacter cavernae]